MSDDLIAPHALQNRIATKFRLALFQKDRLFPVRIQRGDNRAENIKTSANKTMNTSNTIEILGDSAIIIPHIYKLAADIQDWPLILPHYRYMRILERSESRKVADFGASRDGIPVSWSAEQELFPETNRITFKHIRGVTKGMWVEWKIEPISIGAHVSILHELDYPVPVLGSLFANHIVGKLFVENIANKTLRCFKAKVEAEHPA